MTEAADQPAKPLRTWRPMVFWSAGILLALGLIGFGAKIYATHRETDRAVVKALTLSQTIAMGRTPLPTHDGEPVTPGEVVQSLGTPDQAAAKLKWYLRLVWGKSAQYECTKRETAVSLLRLCGRAAEGPLLEATRDRDPNVRSAAAEALKKIRGEEAGK